MVSPLTGTKTRAYVTSPCPHTSKRPSTSFSTQRPLAPKTPLMPETNLSMALPSNMLTARQFPPIASQVHQLRAADHRHFTILLHRFQPYHARCHWRHFLPAIQKQCKQIETQPFGPSIIRRPTQTTPSNIAPVKWSCTSTVTPPAFLNRVLAAASVATISLATNPLTLPSHLSRTLP